MPERVLVIGAGPAGYVAALRARQCGFEVTCVDARAAPGGTCLHIGCIPSKALLHASHFYALLSAGGLEEKGIALPPPKLDLPKMQAYRQKSVANLARGVSYLLQKNGIEFLHGTAALDSDGLDAHSVSIRREAEAGRSSAADSPNETRQADHIILATGSVPASLPEFSVDEKTIVSSTGALEFAYVPRRLAVIGAGAIGIELGSVWQRLGAKITLIEFQDSILPGQDLEMVRAFQRILTRQGLELRTNCRAAPPKRKKSGELSLSLFPARPLAESAESASPKERLTIDKILIAVGRKPALSREALQRAGIESDARGFIKTDARFRTNKPGVYAIGDTVKGPMLAHKAEEDAIACVDMIAGIPARIDYALVPSIVYTEPEFASIGETSETLKAQNRPFRTGIFPLAGNARAQLVSAKEGSVKILACAETDRILGAHVIALGAGELIQQIANVMAFGGSAEDIACICHGHPGLSEAVREAALAVDGRVLHM